jgi:hypothetical protein
MNHIYKICEGNCYKKNIGATVKKLTFVVVIFCLITGKAFSQLDDRFGSIDENDIINYAKPMVTTLGTGLNSGGFHTAEVAKIFGFSIGIKAMMIFIPNDQMTFNPKLPAGYRSGQPSATIWGDKGGIYSGPFGFVTYPDGFNQTSIPFGVPQAAISTFGTELLVRFIPSIKINENEFNFLGIGVKHSISQWIPLIPVDVAVQVLYNKLEVTNLISSTNLAFNAHASKSLGVFTAYGGLQYESSNFKLDYTINGDPASGNPLLRNDRKISVDINGDNRFRIVIGGALNLAFLTLSADYSLGSQSVFTGGLTFGF